MATDTNAKAGSAKAAAGATKPVGRAKKPMTAEEQKQLAVVGVAAVVVALVGYSIYVYFNNSGRSGVPRLNEPPVRIARFIGTTDFDQLPYDRQRLYMKELSGKKKELETEFRAGKLKQDEWEDTLAVLWLGKQFKHIDHYHGLGPFDKKAYIDELIDDEIKDDMEDAGKPKDDVKRDKDKVKRIVARFPDQERRAYDAFRHALKEREKEREKEAKAAARAAKAAAASRPATRENATAPAGTAAPGRAGE
jgi:hypothetical protein